MNKMLFTVAQVVPHSNGMILIDEIIDYAEHFLTAKVQITSQSKFLDQQGVPAWVGVEYMAQAIAAWSGVQSRLNGKTVQLGFLVGTRKYTAHQPYFPLGIELIIQVTQEYFADQLGVFQCSIHSDQLIAEATLNVYQPEEG